MPMMPMIKNFTIGVLFFSRCRFSLLSLLRDLLGFPAAPALPRLMLFIFIFLC